MSGPEPSLDRAFVSEPELFVDGLAFPEGPRWHRGELWLSDIHRHRVLRIDAHGDTTIAAELDDRPSGLGFLPDGTPLVVSMLDRQLLRVSAVGTVKVHADLSRYCDAFCNDMVVDRHGRAYVGARNTTTDEPADCVLRVDPDGAVHVAATGLHSPNGSIVTADGSTLIVAETARGRLTAFDIAADGTLSSRRTLIELPGHHFDGICLDDHGDVWIGGGAAGLLHVRCSPRPELVTSLHIPGRMVIACVFGGPRRSTLFLATTDTTLLENLRYIGADRTRDHDVNSDGRILRIETTRAGGGIP